MTKDEMIERIEIVANAQRNRMIGDPIKAWEYLEAEKGAVAYRDAGYSGEVPMAVLSLADAMSWTPRQACDDIIMDSVVFHMAIGMIRSIRLKAKYAIPSATDEEAFVIYEKAITDMKALWP